MNTKLKDILKKYKQLKLLDYIKNLEQEAFADSDQKLKNLEDSIKKVDLDFFFNKIVPFKETKNLNINFKPHPVVKYDYVNNSDKKEYYKNIGEDYLKKGKVAFLVVAGGQGSRLGFDHPKGMFPVGPITNKSLFQIHTEKVIGFSRLYNFKPIFLIMTSETNDEETRDFFEKNKYFGLDKEDIIFFKQGMLPAIDFENNLILEKEDSLFFAPDGHGGTLFALKRNGVIDILKERKIEIISYFQVDNPLVNIADPIFIGLHIDGKYEVSSKVLKKRDWKEKVGVPAFIDGRPGIVEYSDLPDELAKMTDENGELLYGYGSIAIHLFNVDFIDRISSKDIFLPYHIAKKKIPFYDIENYKLVVPSENNGIKFEQFIFDSIPFSEKALFYETLRDIEFKPLKNKEGEDSIETCIDGISNFYKIWFKNSNFNIDNLKLCEISSLFAVTEEEFRTKIWNYIKNLPEKLYIE
ncbi:MAG: UDPGP type 1 family protein [Spirochaetes bacterium]|nr:UDPGP type 1 family protein [Spirochaetota bacterium]